MSSETLLYDVSGPIATITLNRPDRLNTIVPPMPDEFESAVREATLDSDVKVIVLRGAGRSFCGGYDFAGGFHHWDEGLTTDGRWDPGKDFALAVSPYGPTQKFMSMWRTPKPVIAQVHGWCVGGGSDMALCADLINAAVPFEKLEATVAEQAEQLARIPSAQLAAMKLVVNQAYENMGLRVTQTLGPILDGLMRNTPEGVAFVETARTEGVRAAIVGRDGPFGDYSAAGPDHRPNPSHTVTGPTCECPFTRLWYAFRDTRAGGLRECPETRPPGPGSVRHDP